MNVYYQRLNSFFRHYILAGVGWSVQLEPDILMDKQAGSQLAKDIIQNFDAFFRRHKTYIRRKSYCLTIFPLKGLFAPLLLILLPFGLLHELTHAFAIKYLNSEGSIILLPLLTEVPLLSVVFIIDHLPFPLFLIFLLFGLIGLSSITGDGICFIKYYKEKRKIVNLSSLF